MRDTSDYENRLFQILTNESFSPAFIAGVAGDRVQSAAEAELYQRLLHESGSDFYVKLLFFITHEVFDRESAIALWSEIIDHKAALGAALGRNVEITVATLDYLTNIKNELPNPRIVGEAFIGKLAEMSSVDPLTKLFNRQHLRQVLEDERLRCVRYGIPFSVLMMDIDRFKLVNDRLGHQRGDEVLIRCAKTIAGALRELDTCTRYGGDEFLAVLPHTRAEGACEIAERIRRDIEAQSPDLGGVTLSVGVACMPTDAMTAEALIKAADEALYRSKAGGRNKTTLWTP